MALIGNNYNELYEDPFAKKSNVRERTDDSPDADQPIFSMDETDETTEPDTDQTPVDETKDTDSKNKKINDTSLIGENTDGRVQFHWKSRYPVSAYRIIKVEAIYNFILFLVASVLIFINYLGVFNSIFAIDASRAYFRYMIYFGTAGLMGGTAFEIKILCHVVAKGYWNLDRHYWRLMSPLLSMGIAVIVGAMAGAGLLTDASNSSNAWAVALGFFSGYFSVNAVTKMREMAEVVFGQSTGQQ